MVIKYLTLTLKLSNLLYLFCYAFIKYTIVRAFRALPRSILSIPIEKVTAGLGDHGMSPNAKSAAQETVSQNNYRYEPEQPSNGNVRRGPIQMEVNSFHIYLSPLKFWSLKSVHSISGF